MYLVSGDDQSVTFIYYCIFCGLLGVEVKVQEKKPKERTESLQLSWFKQKNGGSV